MSSKTFNTNQSVSRRPTTSLSVSVSSSVGSSTRTSVITFTAAEKEKNKGIGKPEFRVLLMVPASCLIPVGLLWYGWSGQGAIHWSMPDIGKFIFGLGAIVCLQCAQIYIIGSYQRYAASCLAAVVVLRSIAGFSFPIFAPYIYGKLHYMDGEIRCWRLRALSLGFQRPLRSGILARESGKRVRMPRGETAYQWPQQWNHQENGSTPDTATMALLSTPGRTIAVNCESTCFSNI